MECSFKVGDRVICIDARGHDYLVKGQEYVIRDVRPWRLWIHVPGVMNARIGVRLQGVKRPWPDVPFVCTRFRPVQETGTSTSARRYVDPQRFKDLLDIVRNPLRKIDA